MRPSQYSPRERPQSGYVTLQRQCAPLTSAITSNVQFIAPTVCPPIQSSQPTGGCPPMLVDTINSSAYIPMLESPDQVPVVTTMSKAPAQWGPHLWYVMHTAAANYPDAPSTCEQNGMQHWLQSLKWIIPCKSCAQHYAQYIEPPKLKEACASRQQLFSFLVDLHNAVNERLGKPIMSIEDARVMWM